MGKPTHEGGNRDPHPPHKGELPAAEVTPRTEVATQAEEIPNQEDTPPAGATVAAEVKTTKVTEHTL